jgi:hypothetical protein
MSFSRFSHLPTRFNQDSVVIIGRSNINGKKQHDNFLLKIKVIF